MTNLMLFYFAVWSYSAVLYMRVDRIDRNLMVENFFIGATLIMALIAGGSVSLLIAERKARGRIIVSEVHTAIAEKTEHFERVQQQYVDLMVEFKQLRDDYKKRTSELAASAVVQRTMLVVEGWEDHLHWDMVELEAAGFLVETLHNPTKKDFKARLDAARQRDSMPYYVHFSMHGTPKGIEFKDGHADPLWLNRQLRGARYVSLATCESSSTAYKMRLGTENTLCFIGTIDTDPASRFIRTYYRSIISGQPAREAFWAAKAASPAEIADVAIMI